MLKNDNMKKSYPLVISCHQAEHNKAQEGKALYKILKTIYDLKAEVGTLRKAMDRHRISTDGEPEPKNGKGFQFEKQKLKLAGIAKKKGKLGNLQARSLVLNREISMTDSVEEEKEEQCNNVMVFVEPKSAPVNYRTMSAKLSFMTRFNHADVKEAAYKMIEAR